MLLHKWEAYSIPKTHQQFQSTVTEYMEDSEENIVLLPGLVIVCNKILWQPLSVRDSIFDLVKFTGIEIIDFYSRHYGILKFNLEKRL